MNLLSILSKYFLSYTSLFYWRNLIEISFFAVLFYYAAQWLKKDNQKNLLLYFYGYCAIAFTAHFLNLTTISYTLFLFAPVIAMIFILIHQETLQKNIIALKNITPAQQIHFDWLETIIKTSLLAINNKQSITCIIERKDSLADFLTTPLQFNAQLEQSLLDILLASSTFDQTKMIWIDTQGHLVGMNAIWKHQNVTDKLENIVHKLPQWKQEALFYTTKTDALVLHISPETRTFDIVMNGMIIDRMHAAKTIELIKKYVVSKKPQKMEAVSYENLSQKNTFKQRTP